MKTTLKLSGLFIFFSFLLTIYAYFLQPSFLVIASILVWIAFILLFKMIVHKTLLYILISVTFLCWGINYFSNFEINFSKVLSVNAYLLCLLIGVGFLRLIATPKEEKIKALPQGKESFLKTYLGIHLFGSVINLSSLLLVGDKMTKYAPLSKLQIIVLTRAFSSDAYWSPFFVAFAAALTYAPKLNTFTILISGIVLAVCTFVLTFLEIKKDSQALESFRGYPIHFETLYIPFILTILVLLTHYYFPNVQIIILISLYSFCLCLLILPFKTKTPFKHFFTHIFNELPNMKNELALFLIAGAFGVMLSSILTGLHIQFPFETLNGLSASVLLFILIVLSFIGIHPIISIAVIGNWMEELNHTLLAVTFLMSWATAVSTSPFSGLNLTMQSRYNLKAIDLFNINIFYAFKMYCICVLLLFAMAYYLNV